MVCLLHLQDWKGNLKEEGQSVLFQKTYPLARFPMIERTLPFKQKKEITESVFGSKLN